MEGEAEIYKGKKYTEIRALLGGLNEIFLVGMLTEDYIKRTGHDTLEKALASRNPPRVIMKPAGSTVPPSVRMLFEGLGLTFDKYKAAGGQIIQVDVGQIPSMFRDGRADLYFESASPGHPATVEASTTVNVRFLDLPEKSLAHMAKNGLKVVSMPVHFKGQHGPVKAVDFGTDLVVHKDMPESTAYAITKAVIDNRDAIVADNKAMQNFVARDAWKPENNGIPLHPGAIRFYKERLDAVVLRLLSPRWLVAAAWLAFQLYLLYDPLPCRSRGRCTSHSPWRAFFFSRLPASLSIRFFWVQQQRCWRTTCGHGSASTSAWRTSTRCCRSTS